MTTSRQNTGSRSPPNPPQAVPILRIILDYVLSHDWKDYRRFCRRLTDKIIKVKPENVKELESVLFSINHPFFSFNNVSKDKFVANFPSHDVIVELKKIVPVQQEPVVIQMPKQVPRRPILRPKRLNFADIFPEIRSIPISKARQMVSKLDIPERQIQNVLRDALREKGATNMVERKSDSSLEVADLEHFTLLVDKTPASFVAVVKGYRSIKRSRVTWQDISHQVTKAYQATRPDYVVLLLAKECADSLVSHLVNYGKSVGNPNLIILVDTIGLARFLYHKGVIN